MNDRRFKELVNLHLDHRLSDDEAQELEQVLRADPARRRMLSSYVTLQRGCTMLCRSSASSAPARQTILRAIRDAELKASTPARPVSRAWVWGTWSAATGLAAVAAVMVIRIDRSAEFASTKGSALTPPLMVASNVEIPSAAEPMALVNKPAETEHAFILPPHLTLAALGISTESREVGVVSRWSHPLDNLTQAEIDRAASWARAANRPEWAVDASATSRFGAGWPSYPAAQASTVSFTFDR